MIPFLIIIIFGGVIVYLSLKSNSKDTEILVGQKREIREIGERIQEVLDTEKLEKKQEREFGSMAREASKLLKDKRFKLAEKKFLSIIKEDHDNLKSYQGLGLLYLEQEEFEGAAESFSMVTKFDPTNDKAFNNLGMALMNIKKYDEAVSAYEHAIALNPKIVHRYINLALAAQKAGNTKAQIAALEKAVSLEPKKENLELLVEASMKANDDSSAKKALEKLIEIDPNNLEAQRKLARYEKQA